MLCQAPLIQKAWGRPRAARLTAGEQRARVAAFNGLYRALQTAYSAASATTKDTIPYAAELSLQKLSLQAFKCASRLCKSGWGIDTAFLSMVCFCAVLSVQPFATHIAEKSDSRDRLVALGRTQP